ncbi:MAG: hypothetical protein P1U46_01920 [Patescibacteria group bacterium]|nr:hypothetical protein [Patescibacteria group bacterium]
MEFKVTKAMFSIKEAKEVEEIDLSKNKMDFNDVSIEKKANDKQNNNSNPLFNKP